MDTVHVHRRRARTHDCTHGRDAHPRTHTNMDATRMVCTRTHAHVHAREHMLHGAFDHPPHDRPGSTKYWRMQVHVHVRVHVQEHVHVRGRLRSTDVGLTRLTLVQVLNLKQRFKQSKVTLPLEKHQGCVGHRREQRPMAWHSIACTTRAHAHSTPHAYIATDTPMNIATARL